MSPSIFSEAYSLFALFINFDSVHKSTTLYALPAVSTRTGIHADVLHIMLIALFLHTLFSPLYLPSTMRSVLKIASALYHISVAIAFPFESSALRALNKFGASHEGGAFQIKSWNWDPEEDAGELPCGILHYWDLSSSPPELVLSTTYSLVGILTSLNTNLRPHVDEIWNQVARHLRNGESCPIATVEPHLNSITHLLGESASRIGHVPSIPASPSPKLNHVHDDTCTELAELASIFTNTPNFLPNILSLVSLMGSVSRLCGDTVGTKVVGQSLTDLAISVEIVVPGVQFLVAANTASHSSSVRAHRLGYHRLATFLSGSHPIMGLGK